MSATLTIEGKTVLVLDEDGKFHCEDDKGLEADLNKNILLPDGVGGEVPNPAYFYAMLAIEKYGGELVSYDPTTSDELLFLDDEIEFPEEDEE